MSNIAYDNGVGLSDTERLISTARKYFMKNYKPREMIIDRGEGSRIWDIEGNEYIDFSTGIAVNSLGHQDADLLAALDAQSRKIWHTSNVFFTEPPIKLSEALAKAVPFCERVYLCNSGAEANEAAIKLARKWASDNGRDETHREILTFRGSFHGRTLAAVTATAQPKFHVGFEPLPRGFVYCDGFNDIDVVEEVVRERGGRICAIMVEPIQGEGGVVPMEEGFLSSLRQLCDRHDILLILDEIQTGVGRTGSLFAYMNREISGGNADAVQPDIMTVAKGIGCGVPIGATLVGSKLAETFQFGAHGSTFGGNPLMCAVALAAFNKINTTEIMDNVRELSGRIFERLHDIDSRLSLFSDIRGVGMLIGAELKESLHGKAGEITEAARKSGVLILVAGSNVLRLLPALNISATDVDEGMARLEQALQRYADEDG